MVYSKPLP
jgi:hypothetical protein